MVLNRRDGWLGFSLRVGFSGGCNRGWEVGGRVGSREKGEGGGVHEKKKCYTRFK